MKFGHLRAGWKRPIVYRSEIEKFTRGFISPGYLSNLDSIGKGPDRFYLKGKVTYRVTDVIKWLEHRTATVKKPGRPKKRR